MLNKYNFIISYKKNVFGMFINYFMAFSIYFFDKKMCVFEAIF